MKTFLRSFFVVAAFCSSTILIAQRSDSRLEFTNFKTYDDTALFIGKSFIKDLSEKKFENMPVLFSENILFRALIPPSMISSSSPTEVAKYFKKWLTLEAPGKSDVVDFNVEMIGSCLHINYKILETEASGATSYLAQQLYCDIVNGKIQRLALVCTGPRKFKN